MNNEFGFFKHYEIPPEVLGENANITTSFDRQQYSAFTGLSDGLIPFDLASFENDAYDVDNPKRLLRTDMFDLVNGTDTAADVQRMTRLGIVSTVISDEMGYFPQELKVTIDFGGSYSFSELKITCRTAIPVIKIVKYYGDIDIATTTHIPSKGFGIENRFRELYYDVNITNATKIDIIFTEIEDIYHFLWIAELQIGKINILDEKSLIEAEVSEKFHFFSDTFEYNTADLSYFNSSDVSNTLLSKSQLLEHYRNNPNTNLPEIKGVYYIDDVQNNGENTIVDIVGYNAIYTLEKTFLGGMYEFYSVKTLLEKILSSTQITYNIDSSLSDVLVTGYIPITTKRQAIQKILTGTEICCYEKNGVLYFKKDIETSNDVVYDNTNIVENPVITTGAILDSVVLKYHHYYKGNTISEVYNGVLESGVKKRLFFNKPLHSLKAYEVTVDDNGDDVISTTQSSNVTFIERSANYCIVQSSATLNFSIQGKEYIDDVEEATAYAESSSDNLSYSTYDFEATIYSEPDELAQKMFAYKNKRKSINFLTLQPPEIDKKYNILGEDYYIKSVTDRFNGLFEVEAV